MDYFPDSLPAAAVHMQGHRKLLLTYLLTYLKLVKTLPNYSQTFLVLEFFFYFY